MKKLASLAGAGALLLGLAVPALASHLSDDVTIRNRAYVKNRVTTEANSGLNVMTAEDDVEGGEIYTGPATAGASVYNDVNTTLLGCDCLDGDLRIKNKARVKNYVYTEANSGLNVMAAGDDVEGGLIDTGAASAGASVINYVNFTATDGI